LQLLGRGRTIEIEDWQPNASGSATGRYVVRCAGGRSRSRSSSSLHWGRGHKAANAINDRRTFRALFATATAIVGKWNGANWTRDLDRRASRRRPRQVRAPRFSTRIATAQGLGAEHVAVRATTLVAAVGRQKSGAVGMDPSGIAARSAASHCRANYRCRSGWPGNIASAAVAPVVRRNGVSGRKEYSIILAGVRTGSHRASDLTRGETLANIATRRIEQRRGNWIKCSAVFALNRHCAARTTNARGPTNTRNSAAFANTRAAFANARAALADARAAGVGASPTSSAYVSGISITWVGDGSSTGNAGDQ
jgi:hypothetical protein